MRAYFFLEFPRIMIIFAGKKLLTAAPCGAEI